MNQAPSVAVAAVHEDNLAGMPANPPGHSPTGPRVPTRETEPDREASAVTEGDRPKDNVSLRGTTRGLEILISGTPSTTTLGARLTELLAEAPSFFAGSTARVAIDGALPSGALACLEEVATRFEVQIVEIGPVVTKRRRPAIPTTLRPDDVPQVHLAEGTGPIAEETVAKETIEPVGCEPRCVSTGLPALPTDVAPTAAASTEPASTEPASTEPASTEPASTEPVATEPASTEPATTEPASTEPVATEPATTAPVDVASSVASPIVTVTGDAVPDDAAPTEPAAADAAPMFVAHASTAPDAVAPDAAAPSPAALSPATGNNGAPASGAPAIVQLDAIAIAAAAMAAELAAAVPPGPRLVTGPVRSGVIVDHTGHVIVIGDVNPGAEVRAEGSIIVLGRLRGVAHAAIGREAGCIIALSLQPQQLRIGRMVARAADADRPSDGAEIAYATGETIVVERFVGRLPSGLAASM
jgi:septum formation inhibitor MinC